MFAYILSMVQATAWPLAIIIAAIVLGDAYITKKSEPRDWRDK